MCEEVCALPLGGGGLWWLYMLGAGSGDRAGFPSVGTAHLEGINLKPLHLLGLTSSSQLGANEGPAVYPHGVTPLPLQGLSPSSAESPPCMVLEGAPKPRDFASSSPNPPICPRTTLSVSTFAGDNSDQSLGHPPGHPSLSLPRCLQQVDAGAVTIGAINSKGSLISQKTCVAAGLGPAKI